MVQALQAEIEDLLKADAEKEEIPVSRFDEAEALQERLDQQEKQLEDLKSSQVGLASPHPHPYPHQPSQSRAGLTWQTLQLVQPLSFVWPGACMRHLAGSVTYAMGDVEAQPTVVLFSAPRFKMWCLIQHVHACAGFGAVSQRGASRSQKLAG